MKVKDILIIKDDAAKFCKWARRMQYPVPSQLWLRTTPVRSPYMTVLKSLSHVDFS